MELIIPLRAQSKSPLYQQIYDYLKEEIKSGALGAAVRLPSTRALAEHLRVSRSTTQMAYEQLLSEGYIEAVPCKGYYVAGIEGLVDAGQSPEGYRRSPVMPLGGVSAGSEASEEGEAGGYEVDFSPRGIDLNHFPYNTWRRITKETLVDDNKEMFVSGDPQGEAALREAIGTYLHTARGVNCAADQIIVGAGSEYLWMLLSQILGGSRRIAMENPTYKQAYRVFRGLGHEVVPVEMDKSGMEPEKLRSCGADTAYVMPSHQYPMGIIMPVKRRQELLAWAAGGEDRYLIEDDYDSEFRYKGKPIPALQGMDHCGRVIYMGTFSKSIAPAIRIGFLVLPPALLKVYREKAGFYASTVSRIDQNILYQFLVGGHYERHLNRMRAVYKAKHDLLLNVLKPLEPYFEVRGEFAGLHLLLTHRGGMSEGELTDRAKRRGVRVYGLSACMIGEGLPKDESTVLLGYASLTEEEAVKGAELLRLAWVSE